MQVQVTQALHCKVTHLRLDRSTTTCFEHNKQDPPLASCKKSILMMDPSILNHAFGRSFRTYDRQTCIKWKGLRRQKVMWVPLDMYLQAHYNKVKAQARR